MTTHTCMGCGLKTRYSYWRNCTGCGLDTRCSSDRVWPDRYQQAALAFAALARIVTLIERRPTAALALLVPGSLIAMAAVAAYPLVSVPLLILLTVAMAASVRYEDARTPPK
ncbi:hypothetical protein [Mycobacterium colombiense]|uniref:Uncharacterized protein n=1 Tax=Mycobacterium colombiense TaxID=339268 RepID=A0A853M014_9MYCO|nr:hypothetical protein [Mycobacterium colombiense]OBJ17377.1 hypothetical protein A5623_17035 [Mycobacterium colombiense]OBJ24566.1 hypothetical protein A9W93_09390 [Mycobacterium colombiense]OBJ58349.1 hypothetical protein A5628_13900 [Mycobacterium colombiense]OBJ66397.1 hypothetical protein A5627_04660 [Mycobacterium colombiense]